MSEGTPPKKAISYKHGLKVGDTVWRFGWRYAAVPKVSQLTVIEVVDDYFFTAHLTVHPEWGASFYNSSEKGSRWFCSQEEALRINLEEFLREHKERSARIRGIKKALAACKKGETDAN